MKTVVALSSHWKFGCIILFGFVLLQPELRGCEPGQRPGGRCATHTWHTAISPEPRILYQGWGYPRSLEVSSYDADCYPWVSGNGKYLLFASINFNGPPRPGHLGNWDIYRSEWDTLNNCWGYAENIGPPINTGLDERRPTCNAVCDTLYFHHMGLNGNADIYRSVFIDSVWSEPESLLYPINTLANEEHPALSADGMRLYFTSDRPEGYGGKDIWVAYWNGSSWDSVANIGTPVNTLDEETRPFESYDGQRLYFTNQHGGPRVEGSYGGAGDIYISGWTGTGWGAVSLVAAPVNNDLLACSPYETPDGNEIYFGSESWEGARGDEDIWVAKKNTLFPPDTTYGYGNWVKTSELTGAVYVYDLLEDAGGTIYAATACADTAPMGKVFKTTDGGTTWNPCAGFPQGTMVTYSLLIDNDTIYAATYPHGDVFKSIDGGNSWTPTAELPGVTAVRGMECLQNGDILVGTSPYNMQMRNRIFRTTDKGLSWTVTAALQNVNPCKTIYQTANGAVFTGGWGIDSDVIIYRSTDNGLNWDSITVVAEPQCEWSVDAFFEASPGSLYVSGWHPALRVGEGGGFVYLSTDNGLTWNMCSKVIRGDSSHNCRVYDMVDDAYGRLYIGMQPAYDSVVYRTTDGGTTWQSTGGLDGAFECLCLLRASDGTIYAGTTPNGDVFKFSPTAVRESRTKTHGFIDLEVYPNPCIGFASIRFSLPSSSQATLSIFDASGRKMNAIMNGKRAAGQYRIGWNLQTGSGDVLPDGVYFCQLKTESEVRICKIVVIKN
ncbi:MAG: T9SS type A sorting domain-containing protein [candidate division WOR-3 bacterium]